MLLLLFISLQLFVNIKATFIFDFCVVVCSELLAVFLSVIFFCFGIFFWLFFLGQLLVSDILSGRDYVIRMMGARSGLLGIIQIWVPSNPGSLI